MPGDRILLMYLPLTHVKHLLCTSFGPYGVTQSQRRGLQLRAKLQRFTYPEYFGVISKILCRNCTSLTASHAHPSQMMKSTSFNPEQYLVAIHIGTNQSMRANDKHWPATQLPVALMVIVIG